MAKPTTEGRMLRRSIADSSDFASLTPEEAVLFCMIIPHLNTHGKIQGGAAFIKEIICPKVSYLTIEKIPILLKSITEKTDMKWFFHDDRYWIHAVHFTEHQKLDKNKIGLDLLPTYAELKKSSPTLVGNKDKDKVQDKVKVEVKDKKDVLASPRFELPSKEQINESSDIKIIEEIDKVSKELYDKKIFPEVYAFKNKMLKEQKNTRSILHTLVRVYIKGDFKEGAWAYSLKTIEKESQNYNARDYIKTA
jgi:hypothetical protein